MATLSTNNLSAALVQAANLFTAEMFALTDTSSYPKSRSEEGNSVSSIKDATSISSPVTSGKYLSIDIIIDLKKAPYAYAYEYGHPEPYNIFPKNKPVLAFSNWQPSDIGAMERSIKFAGYGTKKTYLFFNVIHPPIPARPFLHPTAVKTKDRIAQILGQGFKEAYLRASVNKVTVIK